MSHERVPCDDELHERQARGELTPGLHGRSDTEAVLLLDEAEARDEVMSADQAVARGSSWLLH